MPYIHKCWRDTSHSNTNINLHVCMMIWPQEHNISSFDSKQLILCLSLLFTWTFLSQATSIQFTHTLARVVVIGSCRFTNFVQKTLWAPWEISAVHWMDPQVFKQERINKNKINKILHNKDSNQSLQVHKSFSEVVDFKFSLFDTNNVWSYDNDVYLFRSCEVVWFFPSYLAAHH